MATDYGKILLEPGKTYALPIKNGHLDIRVSIDPEYPGLDVEYISDMESEIKTDQLRTRPRVLIENNEGVLRAAIWGNPSSEDYSDNIDFTCVEDTISK
jgi:hypothetical protein